MPPRREAAGRRGKAAAKVVVDPLDVEDMDVDPQPQSQLHQTAQPDATDLAATTAAATAQHDAMDIDDDGAGHPSRTLDSIISTEQNTPPSSFDPSDATGGSGGGTSGSNDNPVVREIPVYLSNTLTQHLRLFQFPVRESHLVFDPSSRPAVVRAKPKSKMFELDIPLDTGAALYNQDKGRDFGSGQIAMESIIDSNTEGVNSSSNKIKEQAGGDSMIAPITKGRGRAAAAAAAAAAATSSAATNDSNSAPVGVLTVAAAIEANKSDQPLNMQTLSSVNISAPTKYAVGIMSNGKLHLTLVDKIDQFRPGLGYIDARDSIDKLLSKRGTSALGEGDDMDEDGADEAGGAGKTVQLQMRAAERQEIVEARKASISYMRKELREEPWQLFRYNDEASEEAEMLYRGMFAGSEEVLQVAKPAKLIT